MSDTTITTTIHNNKKRGLFATLLGLSMAIVACGSEGPVATDGDARADGECFASADCNSDEICVSAGIGPGACMPRCDVQADDCGGKGSCDAIGLSAEVNICKEEATPENPPEPEEEPQIVCETDADCEALQPGTICAEWKGAKSCTITCASENDCMIPGQEYVITDFLTCLEDESNRARTACVPDEACFADTDSCITWDLPDGEAPPETPDAGVPGF